MAENRSKWERALSIARSYLPEGSEEEINRMAKHFFARLVVGPGATIGRNMDTGKLTVTRK
jgi:hypothetical protein